MKLENVLAAQFKALRVYRGWTLERLASEARGVGFMWTSADVYRIERGATALGGTKLDLSRVLAYCLVFDCSLSDFLWGEGTIDLGGPLVAMADLKLFLDFDPEDCPVIARELTHVESSSLSRLELTTATRLGITVGMLVKISMVLWGCSMTERRDQECASTGKSERGHVTRKLIKELLTELETNNQKEETR